MAKKNRFHCKTEAQKKVIKYNYAIKAQKKSSVKKTERIEAPYPHFRYYKKSKHPALIVGEQKGKKQDKYGKMHDIEEYKYRKVMHDDRDGRHLNETIYPNPEPRDFEPMHIAKRVRHDDKRNFAPKPLSWKYPKK